MEDNLVEMIQCTNKWCGKDTVYKPQELEEREPWEFLQCPYCNTNLGNPSLKCGCGKPGIWRVKDGVPLGGYCDGCAK